MGFQIKDGTGRSYQARVSSDNRLYIDGVVRSERQKKSVDGDSYLIGSGFVTFTSSNPSAILYFQNDNDFELVITRYLVGVRSSAGSTESHIRGIIYKNPTGISGGAGSPVLSPNVNFGSSNTLTLTSEIGAEGSTITGGSPFASVVARTEDLTTAEASTILPKGSSLAVQIIPPPGNTSLQVSLGINAHRLPEE